MKSGGRCGPIFLDHKMRSIGPGRPSGGREWDFAVDAQANRHAYLREQVRWLVVVLFVVDGTGRVDDITVL
jgi:hypothetical protein